MARIVSYLLRIPRWPVQLLSLLFINSYVTQEVTKAVPCLALNCYACPAAAFACPIGSLQHMAVRCAQALAFGDPIGALQAVPVYVLGILGLAGALIGRGACGWFCPFGFLQELLFKLRARLARRLPLVSPPPGGTEGGARIQVPRLSWLRYGILVVLVFLVPFVTGEPWFSKLCPAGALEAGIPQALLFDYVREQIGWFFVLKLVILAVFLLWMTFTRRPFCRFICPLGAIWSPFNRVSAVRLEVDGETCTECNACQQVCPVDIQIYQSPHSAQCIRCLECVRHCPYEAVRVV
jgi:polyferredoxin